MNDDWPSLERSLEVLSRAANSRDHLVLVTYLQKVAASLEATPEEDRPELIAKFHDGAGQLPVLDDADIGALMLEATAEDAGDPSVRKLLLEHARYRARWCAQSGTSGGESLARAVHFQRIDAKLKASNVS